MVTRTSYSFQESADGGVVAVVTGLRKRDFFDGAKKRGFIYTYKKIRKEQLRAILLYGEII